MRVAVTGAAGRLGRELQALDWGAHTLLPWTRKDADLTDAREVQMLFLRDAPDVVVHAAAWTDVAGCEKDKQRAWENIALATVHVARACADRGVRLVHVSTDYVFSGEESEHPIPVATRPDPINYYALCKVAAEAAARVVPDHLVVRTTMKARGAWKHHVAPTDMWISHSYFDEVADFLREVATLEQRGIVHFGVRDVNVFEMARADRPDVRGVAREELTSVPLPGDIRLKRD